MPLFALDVTEPDERIALNDSDLRLIAAIFDQLQLEVKLQGEADDSECGV